MQMNDRAGPTVPERTAESDLRMLVSQHQCDRSKLEFSMADASTRLLHSKGLARAEHAAVEVDSGRAIVYTQIDEHIVNRGHRTCSSRSHTPSFASGIPNRPGQGRPELGHRIGKKSRGRAYSTVFRQNVSGVMRQRHGRKPASATRPVMNGSTRSARSVLKCGSSCGTGTRW